jgi:hypothetical protein
MRSCPAAEAERLGGNRRDFLAVNRGGDVSRTFRGWVTATR